MDLKPLPGSGSVTVTGAASMKAESGGTIRSSLMGDIV
jgi:hypothetical protein